MTTRHRRNSPSIDQTISDDDTPSPRSNSNSTPSSPINGPIDPSGKLSNNQSNTQSNSQNLAAQYSAETLYGVKTFSTVDPLTQTISKRLSNYTGVLDTRNRRFLKAGDVVRQGRWSAVKRKLFLFSDKLILTKLPEKKGALKVKSTADLDGLYIDARSIEELAESANVKTSLSNVFRVVFSLPEPGQWLISVNSMEERNEWISAIALACSRLKYAAARERGDILQWGWYLSFVKGTIHLAALNNDVDGVLNALKNDPSCLDRRGQEGRTPIHIAAFMNHSKVLSILIERGADVTIRDPAGRTAVHIAAQLGYVSSLDCLLSCPKMLPELYHTISNHPCTSVNLSSTSAIWLCALSRNGEYEKCLRAMVRHCINQTNNQSNDITAGDVLDLRSCDGLTLMEACVVLNLADLIPCLVGLGCTLDLESGDGMTPLSVAAQHGSTEIVSTLIQLGAQVNWRDSTHLNSPLHYAATLEIASYCVANGARLGIRNREGVRVTDIYSTSSASTTLTNAAQLYESRVPVEINQAVQPRPTRVADNGGHPLDTCWVCEDSLIGLQSIGRKRDWCRCCGFVMCSPCLNQSAVFVDATNEQETVAKVCAGCFNRSLYAPETFDKKKKRIARQRAAAAEAANSMWTLEGLTQALTAVQVQPTHEVQQTPIPVPNVIIEQQKKNKSRLRVSQDMSINYSAGQPSPRASPRNNLRPSQSLDTLSLSPQTSNQSNNQSNNQTLSVTEDSPSPKNKPNSRRRPPAIRKRTSSPSDE